MKLNQKDNNVYYYLDVYYNNIPVVKVKDQDDEFAATVEYFQLHQLLKGGLVGLNHKPWFKTNSETFTIKLSIKDIYVIFDSVVGSDGTVILDSSDSKIYHHGLKKSYEFTKDLEPGKHEINLTTEQFHEQCKVALWYMFDSRINEFKYDIVLKKVGRKFNLIHVSDISEPDVNLINNEGKVLELNGLNHRNDKIINRLRGFITPRTNLEVHFDNCGKAVYLYRKADIIEWLEWFPNNHAFNFNSLLDDIGSIIVSIVKVNNKFSIQARNDGHFGKDYTRPNEPIEFNDLVDYLFNVEMKTQMYHLHSCDIYGDWEYINPYK